MHTAFLLTRYRLLRQVPALTGTIRLYAPNGELVIFSRQKMLRLKEDICAYADEGLTQELLRITARQMADFSAAYDVFDGISGLCLGSLRRRRLPSLVRDEWEILDASSRPLAKLQEDSLSRALLRRQFLGSFLPQHYEIWCGAQQVADLRQRFHPLRYELELDFAVDPNGCLDRRLGIAAGLLLGTIAGEPE